MPIIDAQVHLWRSGTATPLQQIDWIPEDDKTLIMGQAICDWLGWQR